LTKVPVPPSSKRLKFLLDLPWNVFWYLLAWFSGVCCNIPTLINKRVLIELDVYMYWE
jgi:hypothetical protein